MRFDLPIYWTDDKNKTILLGMNKYERMNPFVRNAMKKELYLLIRTKIKKQKIPSPYIVKYKLYYKNVTCDASNIVSVIEKLMLDALQVYNYTSEDSVLHHVGSQWIVAGKDIKRPRIEIEISSI